MHDQTTTRRCTRAFARAAQTLRGIARSAVAATLCVSVFAATAADATRLATSAQLVKPGLYRIGESDGSMLLRVGADGAIVVDARGDGAYGRVIAEIARLATSGRPAPVRALILTASGSGQARDVARFVDAGIPLIVHQQALAALRDGAPAPRAAPPRVVTYDMDYRLIAAGMVAEVEHVGRGRSGADSVVLFPDLRVVAVGDLYTAGTPQPDCASGGSYAGWAAAIAHLLWSDFDVAVPSRGPAVGKAELAAFKARLEALAERDTTKDRTGCLVTSDATRQRESGRDRAASEIALLD